MACGGSCSSNDEREGSYQTTAIGRGYCAYGVYVGATSQVSYNWQSLTYDPGLVTAAAGVAQQQLQGAAQIASNNSRFSNAVITKCAKR